MGRQKQKTTPFGVQEFHALPPYFASKWRTLCAWRRGMTRTGICRALQGFRHGSGAAMLRPHARGQRE